MVAGGNAIGGAGHLRDIGIHAASPGTLAFVGREVEGRTVIAVDRGEGLAKVVASGEPTPLGGTFDLPGDGLALQGDSVLFSSAVKDGTAPAGLFRVDPGGGVAPLVRSGAAAPGGGRFKRIESVLTAGPRGVVFSATLDDDREGLYLVRGARVRQVAITGNRLPGVRGQSIASFDAVAASQGHLELNVFKPVLAHAMLQSVRLLSDAARSFTDRCVVGIRASEPRIREQLERSLMLVTALTPKIGYDKAARIAKAAHANGTTLREEAIRLGFVTPEEFDKAIDPKKMVRPG